MQDYLLSRFAAGLCAEDATAAEQCAEGTTEAGVRLDKPTPAILARLGRAVADLNQVKAEMDSLDQERLGAVLRVFDPYRNVRRRLAYPGVTNAWLKMYEIADHFDLRKRLGRRPRVFCNAELPGSFLLALDTYYRGEMDWVASSLLPDKNGTALGDHHRLLRDYPERWLMGDDLPGDLTDPDQVRRLAARAGPRDLYTADGGMDIGTRFSEQEQINEELHLGQAECGLHCLAPGGVMVLKHYTLSRKRIVRLVGRLARLFEEVHVVKPLTSRAANSECYLVCLGRLPEASVCRLGGSCLETYHALLSAVQALCSLQAAQVRRVLEAYRSGDRPPWLRDQTTPWLRLYRVPRPGVRAPLGANAVASRQAPPRQAPQRRRWRP